jgi:hypothetical protein
MPQRLDFEDKMRTRALSEILNLHLPGPGVLYVELVEGNNIVAQYRVNAFVSTEMSELGAMEAEAARIAAGAGAR